MGHEALTVGRIARRVGISPSAVRFYERRGLIASHRLANGYRNYGGEAAAALRFVVRAKALGFSLEEMRQIIEIRRSGAEPCGCVATMIESNLAAIDRRIADLAKLRRQLRALARQQPGRAATEAICPIIEGGAEPKEQPLRKRA